MEQNFIYTEEQLEDKLVTELISNGYEYVELEELGDVMLNLRHQITKLNNITAINDEDWQIIERKLLEGDVFDKAKLLRDGLAIKHEGERKTIYFLNQKKWCQNLFQVTNQVSVNGKRKNRYDVTILINGFPLVQIELKRPGLDIKQAFHQCIRYKRDSMRGAIFDYIQMFIISNNNQTRYFANSNEMSDKDYNQVVVEFKDANNQAINELAAFSDHFLEKCQLSKLIIKYMIVQDVAEERKLILMRPYQVHAVEAINNLIDEGVENGYVWHTTGSGKTLTSFKAAQMISERDDVDKVLFIVDRADLDAQTTAEYKKFGSFINDELVKEYKNTRALVNDINNDTQKLMVTTIQKLDNAIKKDRYNTDEFAKKRIVLIFDECHRSQKGDMHRNIAKFFNHVQKIGFTGTPIFVENKGHGYITTEDIFGKCLHKYILPHAIKDQKVLGFSVEYYNPFKLRKMTDKEVRDIDLQEAYDSDDYIRNVCQFIINNIDKNTHNREFNAMLCVSGVKSAIKYYKMFQELEHDLKVASIFTWQPNAEQTTIESDQDGLEYIINDYNKQFNEHHTIDNFSHYRVDLMQKVKYKSIDLVIVSDMLLTGFDAKYLNTLYVDKNLAYHLLIQAFSRTNRLCNAKKSYGNVVCFRPLKTQVDAAIRLFSDNNPETIVLKEPYEAYLEKANAIWQELSVNFPRADAINNLVDPEDERAFINLFKNLSRNTLALESFFEFNHQTLPYTKAEILKYKDVYIALHNKSLSVNNKESILADVDFEMELVVSDKIDYEYIFKLLRQIKVDKSMTFADIKDKLKHVDMLTSKRELLYQFIEQYLAQKHTFDDAEDVAAIMDKFMRQYKHEQVLAMIKMENLKEAEFISYVQDCEWDHTHINEQEIERFFITQPSFLERDITFERIITNLRNLLNDTNF